MKIKAECVNAPQWKTLTVKATLPEELKCLGEMAHNMWWVWNHEARDLLRELDTDLYHETRHNPVMLLERLTFARKEEILRDKALMKRINDVYAKFRAYMDVEPDRSRPSVAYFCMEYGLHSALKIYSGGLGMLAGDYVKEASFRLLHPEPVHRRSADSQLRKPELRLAAHRAAAGPGRQPVSGGCALPELSCSCVRVACQRGSRKTVPAGY